MSNTTKASTPLILALIFALLTFEESSAQAPNWLWSKGMSGAASDFGRSIAVDPVSGAVYTAGFFSGTVDFDPGPGAYNLTPVGYQDLFISKLDSSGNFLWAKTMGGANYNLGFSIALDPAGSGAVYTSGWFQGTIDFDPGAATYNLTSPEYYYWSWCPIPDCPYPENCFEPCYIPGSTFSMFISKLDVSGNFEWAKAISAMADESGVKGFSIAVDPTGDGDVYATGTYWGTVDLNPGAGTYPVTGGGMIVSKLNSSGNFVWGTAINKDLADGDHSLALDTSGNVYITGTGQNLYVSKLNNSGALVWAKEMQGPGTSFGYAIDVDPASGDVYTTGSFNGTVDFDPGGGIFNLSSTGNSNMFISKLNSSGDFIWARAMLGNDLVRGQAIVFDPLSGDVYTTGLFGLTADFNPGAGVFNLTSAGLMDVFISKLDGSGDFVWADVVGGTGDDYGLSLALNNFENVHLTGFFGSPSVLFGATTLMNGGGEDVFIAKLDRNPNTGIVTSASDNSNGSLRKVISAATPGATISFSLAPMSQITLTSGEILIDKDLILSGPGILDLTISGNNASRIFQIQPGKNFIIKTLSLKNGTAVTNGGAALVEGNLTLENVLLQNNAENGSPKSMSLKSTAELTVIGNVNIKN